MTKPLTVTVNPLPKIVRIDLRDDLSALPSSNRRRLYGGRSIRDPKAQKHLAAMTLLFNAETALIKPLVRFDTEPVHILIILGERFTFKGHRVGRWDSHNMAKVVVDWLQDVGVIADDSRAEVICVKRKDYFDAHPITSLIIQPRRNVHNKIASIIDYIHAESLLFQPHFEAQNATSKTAK